MQLVLSYRQKVRIDKLKTFLKKEDEKCFIIYKLVMVGYLLGESKELPCFS